MQETRDAIVIRRIKVQERLIRKALRNPTPAEGLEIKRKYLHQKAHIRADLLASNEERAKTPIPQFSIGDCL